MGRFRRHVGFAVALAATLVAVLLYGPVGESGPMRRLEGQLLDLWLRLRPEPAQTPDLAVVLIDDRSIAEIGRWPWSRVALADGLDRLTDAGARVVVIDLLFSEPEVGNPAADARLAAAMRRHGRVILPFAFERVTQRAQVSADAVAPDYVQRTAFGSALTGPGADLAAAPAGVGLQSPIAILGRAAHALGHANVPVTGDGAARFEYPVVAYGGAFYPSLAVAAARSVIEEANGGLVDLGHGLRLGGRTVVTDETMLMTIPYLRPGRIPTYAFADLAAGRIDPALLAGRIVLIGGAAAGVGTRFATPFSPVASGAERQANVVASVVIGDGIVRRSSGFPIGPIAVVAAGLVLGLIAYRGALGTIALAYGVIALAFAVGNVWLFMAFGDWYDLVYPEVAFAIVFLTLGITTYRANERRQRQVRHAFRHYLHPAVMERLSQNPDLVKLGGEEQVLTVLFADIRDFTSLSERLAPEALVRLLNIYFTVMTGVIVSHGGMLDKFVGDGLVAVFGAPLPQPDHAARACATALAMRRALPALAQKLDAEGLSGIAVDIGIGINTGRMVIGNMGSDERFDFTVVGQAVNVGSRLEAMTKTYRTGILIGEDTQAAIGEAFVTRQVDTVAVRGGSSAARVFELRGPAPATDQDKALLSAYGAAMTALEEGQAGLARQRFGDVLALVPDDGPSHFHLTRGGADS
ncbi:MAG: CHASE2 domain-containing protein [Inquilinaceae bacterium]